MILMWSFCVHLSIPFPPTYTQTKEKEKRKKFHLIDLPNYEDCSWTASYLESLTWEDLMPLNLVIEPFIAVSLEAKLVYVVNFASLKSIWILIHLDCNILIWTLVFKVSNFSLIYHLILVFPFFLFDIFLF